jgi:hypothetical protein
LPDFRVVDAQSHLCHIAGEKSKLPSSANILAKQYGSGTLPPFCPAGFYWAIGSKNP